MLRKPNHQEHWWKQKENGKSWIKIDLMHFTGIKAQRIFNTHIPNFYYRPKKSHAHSPLDKLPAHPHPNINYPFSTTHIQRSSWNPQTKTTRKSIREQHKGAWITCTAMTSGSRSETNLVNSGQLFLTRIRKLLAFHVKNFNGSFFFSSSETWSVFSSPSSFEREGFLEEPSFPIGSKYRFITHKLDSTLDLLQDFTTV